MIKNRLEKIRLQISARRGRVVKQVVFARFLGANKSLYNRWAKQRGQPGAEWLAKIAKKLKCSIDDLIERDPE